jgi:hypothetical protein
MHQISSKQMYIYVSGPYSAQSNEPNEKKQQIIDANITKAEGIALEIAKKGHFPFVPHTMMRNWENMQKIERSRALDICKKWVEKCDALYFIGESPGAEEERQVAISLQLPIYREVKDIPQASSSSSSRLSSEAIQGYLTEYQQCMESYRHTYATIWQAGAIFAAISAALVAFAEKGGSGVTPLIQLLAPLPILFWWQGIFRPMNRYGELRRKRLEEIENTLSDPTILGLQMRHFRSFNQPVREGFGKRLIKFKWVWQPRVIEIVRLFGFSILGLEIYLVVKRFFS